MTWHQWQVEYPTERKIGWFSWAAFSNASLPHGYQSTGLWACCRRYGLVSSASRFVCGWVPVAVSVTRPVWHQPDGGVLAEYWKSVTLRLEGLPRPLQGGMPSAPGGTARGTSVASPGIVRLAESGRAGSLPHQLLHD